VISHTQNLPRVRYLPQLHAGSCQQLRGSLQKPLRPLRIVEAGQNVITVERPQHRFPQLLGRLRVDVMTKGRVKEERGRRQTERNPSQLQLLLSPQKLDPHTVTRVQLHRVKGCLDIGHHREPTQPEPQQDIHQVTQQVGSRVQALVECHSRRIPGRPVEDQTRFLPPDYVVR
jgi:hypothetical protein